MARKQEFVCSWCKHILLIGVPYNYPFYVLYHICESGVIEARGTKAFLNNLTSRIGEKVTE